MVVGKMGRTPGSGFGAFAWGAAAAVVASRVLPPLIAQLAGSARVNAESDPFAALAADHRKFSALLGQMEQSEGGGVFNRMQLLLRLKRRLAAHAMAEEDIVYPLLHDRAEAADAAKRLYAEHAEVKIHLHALEQLPKDSPDWAARAGELKRLIESHARDEEETEFPKLRRLLNEAESTRLSGDIQREKAMVL